MLKSKLLDCLNSGKLSPNEMEAFHKWHTQDQENGRNLSYGQREWLLNTYAKLFDGKRTNRTMKMPSQLGPFEVRKLEGGYHLIVNGVTIAEPITLKFGREIIQFLHDIHRFNGIEKILLALPEEQYRPTPKVKTLDVPPPEDFHEEDPF